MCCCIEPVFSYFPLQWMFFFVLPGSAYWYWRIADVIDSSEQLLHIAVLVVLYQHSVVTKWESAAFETWTGTALLAVVVIVPHVDSSFHFACCYPAPQRSQRADLLLYLVLSAITSRTVLVDVPVDVKLGNTVTLHAHTWRSWWRAKKPCAHTTPHGMARCTPWFQNSGHHGDIMYVVTFWILTYYISCRHAWLGSEIVATWWYHSTVVVMTIAALRRYHCQTFSTLVTNAPFSKRMFPKACWMRTLLILLLPGRV